MKKIALIISILISFLYFSCSNNHSSEIINYSDDSLKLVAQNKEQSLQWTRELESVRLVRDISKNDFVSSELSLSPQVMCVSYSNSKKVYPLVENFAVLNTGLITKDILSFLDNFFQDFSIWNFNPSFFENESLFTIILFKYDIENQWKEKTGLDFPYKKTYDEEILSETEKTSSKAVSALPDECEAENIKIFSSYLIGEPFFAQNTVEIPLRCTIQSEDKSYLDIVIFVNLENDYKIYQIKTLGFKKK